MTEPVISRELIAARAEQDAINALALGIEAVCCPYPFDSEAAREWRAAFQRYKSELAAEEGCDGSA